jgi:hypothetical protein
MPPLGPLNNEIPSDTSIETPKYEIIYYCDKAEQRKFDLSQQPLLGNLISEKDIESLEYDTETNIHYGRQANHLVTSTHDYLVKNYNPIFYDIEISPQDIIDLSQSLLDDFDLSISSWEHYLLKQIFKDNTIQSTNEHLVDSTPNIGHTTPIVIKSNKIDLTSIIHDVNANYISYDDRENVEVKFTEKLRFCYSFQNFNSHFFYTPQNKLHIEPSVLIDIRNKFDKISKFLNIKFNDKYHLSLNIDDGSINSNNLLSITIVKKEPIKMGCLIKKEIDYSKYIPLRIKVKATFTMGSSGYLQYNGMNWNNRYLANQNEYFQNGNWAHENWQVHMGLRQEVVVPIPQPEPNFIKRFINKFKSIFIGGNN